MSQPVIRIKRGASFAFTALRRTTTDGLTFTPEDLTPYTIAAQVRTQADGLVDTLAIVGRNNAAGTVDLAASGSTATWPVGVLVVDIRYTATGASYTETVLIEVERQVTRT